MSEPDYVVLRPDPDLPPGTLSPRDDGLWLDRSQVAQAYAPASAPPGITQMTAVPTGRFEVRDYDGVIAEVYEVRLADTPPA